MIILILIWLAQWLILSPHFGMPPIYDAAWNYSDLQGVLSSPQRLSDSVLSGHTTMAYVQLLLLSQRLDPGNVALVAATNHALLAAATGVYWLTAKKLFSAPELQFEAALSAALFGLSPVVLANLLHLNWDFGVLIFEIFFLGALLSGRLWLAGLFGLAMAMSKENGAFLYAAAVVLYAVVGRQETVDPRSLIRRLVPLLWPLLFYAGAVYVAFGQQGAKPNIHLELDSYVKNSWALVYRAVSFDLSEPGIQSYLADIFALNFSWILSLPLLLFVGLRILGKARVVPDLDRRGFRFIGLLLVVVLYMVTRYCPFNNVRYMLTAVPLLILMQVYGLIRLLGNVHLRRCVLGLCLALSAASNFRTLDPVSKAIFGTFPFGNHSCLRLASPIFPHWIGRDELVYNLEFLRLGTLQDLVFQDIGLRPETVVFVAKEGDFWVPGWIGANSQRTTRRTAGNFEFHFCVDPNSKVAGNADCYFLDFPNVPQQSELTILRSRFGEPQVKLYEQDGYSLKVYRFSPPPRPI